MRIRKLAAAAAAALALGVTSVPSHAITGPFYSCVRTKLVQFEGTVVDAAVATPELSTLVTAVTAAGLADDLAAAENITVYAPTNAAFAKIPESVLNEFLANADVLGAVLGYHVTPGIEDPRRWSDTVRRPTLAGQPVFLYTTAREAKVNQATVNCRGVRTSNGVVWLIDSVLLPQF